MKIRTGLICSMTLLSGVLKAQTYWDANTNGQPVKEELAVRFDQTGTVVDTTTTSYYADGKLDTYYHAILIGRPDEEKFWNRQTRVYHYKSDTLYMIKNTNSSQYGTESSLEISTQNYQKIFPLFSKSYISELKFLSDEDPDGEMISTYTEDGQILTQRMQNEHQTSVSKFIYENSDLIRIEGNWEDAYGNSDSWTVDFEVTQKEKYGWSEMLTVMPDETRHRTVRTVTTYSKEDLKNPIGYVDKASSKPEYSLSEIMELWRGDVYSFSPSEQRTADKTKLLELGVELFEKDRTVIYNTDYSPLFFYKSIVEFYYQNNRKLAINWAKRGLDFFDESDGDATKELSAITAYLYRDLEMHSEALEYYQRVPPPEYGVYDPMGNYYETTMIKFLIRGGKLEKARELLTPLHNTSNELVRSENFKAENAQLGYILFLKNLGEIGELMADRNQGYHAAEFYYTVVKDYFEATEGKESEEYINSLKDLIRVKKAIQK